MRENGHAAFEVGFVSKVILEKLGEEKGDVRMQYYLGKKYTSTWDISSFVAKIVSVTTR